MRRKVFILLMLAVLMSATLSVSCSRNSSDGTGDSVAATTDGCVRHILMWTLSEDLTEEQKLDVIKKAETSMKKFEKEIPGLLRASVIYQGRLESSNCDFMFDMLFESRKALEDFSVNPEHLAVVAELKPSITGRTCLDVEL